MIVIVFVFICARRHVKRSGQHWKFRDKYLNETQVQYIISHWLSLPIISKQWHKGKKILVGLPPKISGLHEWNNLIKKDLQLELFPVFDPAFADSKIVLRDHYDLLQIEWDYLPIESGTLPAWWQMRSSSPAADRSR